jgi:hypothetical protein
MKRGAIAVLGVLVLSAGLYFGPGGGAPSDTSHAASSTPVVNLAPTGEQVGEPASSGEFRAAAARFRDRSRADEIRDGSALLAGVAGPGGGEGERAARPVKDEPETERPPGDLKNRDGFDSKLMGTLNEVLMPLVDECIEMAHEREPTLSGMLALEVGAAGDPDLGSVIDYVRFADRNEIEEQELQECVRETAFSLSLPPPVDMGREDLMLTIPIRPTEPAPDN